MQKDVVLGEADFMRHLYEQLQFLRASAIAFDSGLTAEARRLAVVIYTLLIDTAKITSLVTHLGWPDLKMIDSGSMVRKFQEFVRADIARSGGNPANLVMMSSPLTHYTNSPPSQAISLGEGFEKLDRVPVMQWLEQAAIYSQSGPITRKGLVCFLRHKDGGAHIDGKVTQGFYGVVREGAADFSVQVNGADIEITNTAALAMRQIAFEVEASVMEHLWSVAKN